MGEVEQIALFRTIVAVFVIIAIITLLMYALRSEPERQLDFERWCTDVKLLMHASGMLMEANTFDPRQWVDEWYEGESPEDAFNKKYKDGAD